MARSSDQTDAEMVFEQLADRPHATIAKVIESSTARCSYAS